VVTLLVSGSGTDVGKTRVTAALARLAANRGLRVQIVKPVQTGVAPGQLSDAETAATLADVPLSDAHTLRRYPAPLAPLAAATASGITLDLKEVVAEIQKLPAPDVRFIEGAGGLAVPLLTSGHDWGDLAALLEVNAVVLVVPDQLGAINQARLVYDYYRHKNLKDFWALWTGARRANLDLLQQLSPGLVDKAPAGIFLNMLTASSPEVAASTRAGLRDCQVPLWGELAADALNARVNSPLAELLAPPAKS
jgi:dethiobiotin synthase